MSSHNRVTIAGLLIALGIIYGDIGTSPLYVLNAIISGKAISEELIIGVLSLIIWTLTLQTTIKYVILTLRADNKGEGGIFSLFALVRRRKKWPVMGVWFIMLALLGLIHLLDDLSVLKAFNPYYGIKLLGTYPQGFYILGGVFLCTTGAEALYSDLGHCGKWNIRYSWIFVKTCLIINYLGQGAWLLQNYSGKLISSEMIESGFNPFYGVMPH